MAFQLGDLGVELVEGVELLLDVLKDDFGMLGGEELSLQVEHLLVWLQLLEGLSELFLALSVVT